MAVDLLGDALRGKLEEYGEPSHDEESRVPREHDRPTRDLPTHGRCRAHGAGNVVGVAARQRRSSTACPVQPTLAAAVATACHGACAGAHLEAAPLALSVTPYGVTTRRLRPA